jgi:IS605 OrfB family transposase
LHYERTANKRKDFIGKLVYKLYHHQKNNVLVAENLNTSNMIQNKHLSKSISDASWTTFFEWSGNIAERDGFHFHQVDPKYTSQDCSRCGQRSPKKLLWRYEPLTVSFVDTRLTETTTLHEICFIGQLLPFVESVGLPTSMKRETLTKQKTLEALRTQSSYRCLTLGQAQVFRFG